MKTDFYYHYTTIEGLKGIIENKCLWATEINFLNDSSENNYIEDLISRVCSENPLFQKVYDFLYDDSYRYMFFDSNKYITSMSNSQDSLSMWNLYSKGNGFCIKFEKLNLFNLKNTQFFMHETDVIYDVEKQIKNLREIFNSYVSRLPKITKDEAQLKKLEVKETEHDEYKELYLDHGQNIDAFMTDLYRNRNNYKHPAYKEEYETRIITEYELYAEDNSKFRSTTNGQLIEYIELPIRIENIKAIMPHPFISDKIHAHGLKRYLDHMGLSNVLLYKSKIPFRNL